VNHRGKGCDLVVVELRRDAKRREACLPENLVRVRASDAGQRALVAKQRVELSPFTAQDPRERGRVELERVRPEVRQLLVKGGRREQPDAGTLLRAGLGEEQLAAVRESHLEHRLGRALLAQREVAEPARAHQMHPEHEPAVDGREEEVLAASPCAGERSSFERARRWVERFQRRDVPRSGDLDRRARDQRVELAHPGLDLG
jgi:hypothetical protein